MDIEAIRKHCLRFPHTTENIQWSASLCFKVDGKLFVVAALESGPYRLSFKCSPENFAELCERPGIKPAPYMARALWVSLERFDTLPDTELRELIGESYRLVWKRLAKKRQLELQSGSGTKKSKAGASEGKRRKASAQPIASRKKSSPSKVASKATKAAVSKSRRPAAKPKRVRAAR